MVGILSSIGADRPGRPPGFWGRRSRRLRCCRAMSPGCGARLPGCRRRCAARPRRRHASRVDVVVAGGPRRDQPQLRKRRDHLGVELGLRERPGQFCDGELRRDRLGWPRGPCSARDGVVRATGTPSVPTRRPSKTATSVVVALLGFGGVPRAATAPAGSGFRLAARGPGRRIARGEGLDAGFRHVVAARMRAAA